MQNVMSSTYTDGFTVNTTTKDMQLWKQEWKNNNYIYHWTWQILTATVFHSTDDFYKFIGEQNVFWILQSTEMISH